MNFILDLVSSNRVIEILEQLRKEGIDTSRTDKTDGSLLVDEKDLPQALEILKRLGI
jgi:type III secretory pathway lipoprotein EscJ